MLHKGGKVSPPPKPFRLAIYRAVCGIAMSFHIMV